VSERNLPTSSLERFVKLSGLAGRVGVSLAVSRLLDVVRKGPLAEVRRTETLVRNATRIVETLGEMRGAAMKVGQMLSLHADVLPEEAASVLRALQNEAPRVPAEVMRYEVEGALGERFDRLFERFEPEAFAAASIGQVHRARLRDGRDVAVKVQYPLIREIIESDLKNLRVLFQSLFALVSDVDFEPFWEEIRDRLREELDYVHEADNLKRIAALHADMSEVVVPGVVDEASTDRVLTLEYVAGLSADEACAPGRPRELRDAWGRALFAFQMRGLFETGLLHADPNLANFGFLADGRVVVYDFGCVKRVPADVARGLAALTRAALDGRPELVPDLLVRMGIHKQDGSPLARLITDPYFDVVAELYRDEPPYTFGEDEDLVRRLTELGLENVGEASDLVFPGDLIFVNRTLSGHFGNLSRLRCTADWRSMVLARLPPA
jgi:predicted unusual protein kinase regulating ubiquinone biosynthesis (AarF/ABC1/UbiB family)